MNVLLVQPDPALAERLGQLVLAGTPEAAVSFVPGPQGRHRRAGRL